MVRLNGGSGFLIPFFSKPFANGSNERLKITNDSLAVLVKLFDYFLRSIPSLIASQYYLNIKQGYVRSKELGRWTVRRYPALEETLPNLIWY